MASRRSHKTEQTTTPEGVGGSVTPEYVTGSDHSFTLQAVMDLHKSTGALTATVDALLCSIEKQDGKISALEVTVGNVTKKIYAVGVVLAIVVAVGAFMIDKTWVIMVQQITATTATQPIPAPQSPTKNP